MINWLPKGQWYCQETLLMAPAAVKNIFSVESNINLQGCQFIDTALYKSNYGVYFFEESEASITVQ